MATLAETLIQGAQAQAQRSTVGNVGEAFLGGARLAQKKQEIELQKQELGHKKELLAAKRDGEAVKEVGLYLKMSPKLRKAYSKTMEKRAIERGAPYAPEFLQALGADLDPVDVSQRLDTYNAELEKSFALGRPTPELANARAEFAEVAYGGDIGKLQGLEAQEKRARITAEAQRSRLSTQQEQFGIKERRRAVERFTDVTDRLSDDVQAKFKPLQTKKAAVREAHSGLKSMKQRLSKGEQPSSIEFNTVARGLAKAANSGAMTDQDVADFKQETGLANMAEDTIRKWVTGGVNINAVNALIKITQRRAMGLDEEAKKLGQSFVPRFTSPEFPGMDAQIRQRSGIDPFLQPTLSESLKIAPETEKEILDIIKTQGKSLTDVQISNMLSEQFPGITVEQIKDLIQRGRGQ